MARKLEALPVVAEAFGRGEISARHATVVADAYAPGREAEISGVEAEVVDFARVVSTPHELGAVMRRLTDAIDGDCGAAADAAAHERRGCYVADVLNGAFDLKANSDGYSGEFIDAALDAEMKKDLQADDPRTRRNGGSTRSANICRRHLVHGDTGTSHGVRPHVSAVVDVEAMPGGSTDLAALIRGDLRDGGVSATMLELLLCDCDISRVITAGRSEILDVGRTTPTVTAAQWKALVVRDRHCQHPGCNRPPEPMRSPPPPALGPRRAHRPRQPAPLLLRPTTANSHIHDAQARAANRDP